jgi:phosphatidate phosphatase APP1
MMSSGDPYGVIVDVDGVLRWGSLRRQLGRLRALRTTSLRDRRSMLAMPRLVRALAADLGGAPVVYLTAFSKVSAQLITSLLERDGYPSGTLLTTGRSFVPRWIVGGRWKRKLAAIEQIADRMPGVRWVLLGDDGGHDPQAFVEFASRRDGVAVIGLRQVFDVDSPKINLFSPAGGAVGAAVVGAPNGEELLPLVRVVLGIGQPRGDRSMTGSSRSSSAATE